MSQGQTMSAPVSTTTPRELIPSGVYTARCYSIIHYGNLPEKNMKTGQDEVKDKIEITFELPTEMKVFNEDKGPQPLVKGIEVNYFMSEKANLRKLLQTWRGKNFTDEEAANFNILSLMGVLATINIAHKTSSTGREYDYIASISPAMKGLTVPAQINPSRIFDVNNFTQEQFDALHDWQKKKVMTSKEYQDKFTITNSDSVSSQQQLEPPVTSNQTIDFNEQESVDEVPF